MRVLVVEGDSVEADELSRGLRQHGYEVDNVADGMEAMTSVSDADLLLLSLELPDLDGLEVCRRLRKTNDIPIIALTVRDTELDRVLGFQAGVDDCLTKPYGVRELVARMEAIMRRARPPRPPVIGEDGLRIDARTREVRVDGRLVVVTRKEFDLLQLLASEPDAVFSRQQIMALVWGEEHMESSRTIDTHVSSLRSKLGSRSWIVTFRGVGFRLGNG